MPSVRSAHTQIYTWVYIKDIIPIHTSNTQQNHINKCIPNNNKTLEPVFVLGIFVCGKSGEPHRKKAEIVMTILRKI
jgi:hypothetical protein